MVPPQFMTFVNALKPLTGVSRPFYSPDGFLRHHSGDFISPRLRVVQPSQPFLSAAADYNSEYLLYPTMEIVTYPC